MELGKPVKFENVPCPYCKMLIDGAAVAGEGMNNKQHRPSEGDFGICTKCCNWLVYTVDNVREITTKDIEQMSQDNFDDLVKMGLALARMQQVARRLIGK